LLSKKSSIAYGTWINAVGTQRTYWYTPFRFLTYLIWLLGIYYSFVSHVIFYKILYIRYLNKIQDVEVEMLISFVGGSIFLF